MVKSVNQNVLEFVKTKSLVITPMVCVTKDVMLGGLEQTVQKVNVEKNLLIDDVIIWNKLLFITFTLCLNSELVTFLQFFYKNKILIRWDKIHCLGRGFAKSHTVNVRPHVKFPPTDCFSQSFYNRNKYC